MAMVAVQLVVEQLVSVLANEAQLLGGVRMEVQILKDDLESIRSFLQDAEARSVSHKGVKTWVNQVKDVAYDIDDVLELFLLRLAAPQGQGRGFVDSIRKAYYYIQQLRARRYLGVQIQRIKMNINAISERRDKFSFKQADDATCSTSVSTSLTWHDPRRASLFVEEADLVGIENPKRILTAWLVEGEDTLTTISVVGMGGVGKTTLVKKTYDSQAVNRNFHCQAWVTVSKTYTTVELLRAALKGFLEATKEPVPVGLDEAGDLQLVDMIRTHLQHKRYVIVLDDVWDINAWEAVKFALPDCSCGSRIIFTTRIADIIASVETTVNVYNLQPLTDGEAWALFCRKAFRGADQGVCPDELEETSRSILKKCGGLPLAIVIIGGLLSKKSKMLLEWKKVYDSLASEMRPNSSLGRILLLSYDDLQYNLKLCFLYLSVFPEDYLIKRRKMIRLWVSERFVEEIEGLTADEVAENYLNELVSRSMIEAIQINDFNKIQSCRIHDLMREIIQLKCKEEYFVRVVNEKHVTPGEKVRHLAIHLNSEYFPTNINKSRLRTLLVFTPEDPSFYLQHTFLSGYRFLRVLDLDHAPLSELPRELVKLVYLRYLSLKMTWIKELPKSIGKLSSLEILDLKGTLISSLPNGILKLKNLVELQNYHVSNMYDSKGMTVPKGIRSLTNLQKLGSIEVQQGDHTLGELGELTQLKRLGILKLRRENEEELCSCLQKLRHLTSLYMVSISNEEHLKLDPLQYPPMSLQRLYLKCTLTAFPEWVASLPYLSKLVLQSSNLNTDPLEALQNLPNLVILDLRFAYNGQELRCNPSGYPKLKKLVLYQMENLERVHVAKGAMPMLRGLLISCFELETVPLGIEHLTDIEELQLLDMPQQFVKRIERPRGVDFWKVEHIPTLKHVYRGRGRWETEIL